MNRQKREDFRRRAIEAEGKLKLLEDEIAIRREQVVLLGGKYERIRVEHARINEIVLRAMTPHEQNVKGLSYDVESIVDELCRLHAEIEEYKSEMQFVHSSVHGDIQGSRDGSA